MPYAASVYRTPEASMLDEADHPFRKRDYNSRRLCRTGDAFTKVVDARDGFNVPGQGTAPYLVAVGSTKSNVPPESSIESVSLELFVTQNGWRKVAAVGSDTATLEAVEDRYSPAMATSDPKKSWAMSSALNQATSLPARSGPSPQTGPSMPHQQLSDNAPAEIQEKLFERARSLPGVRIGPSRVSVPGARAFFMEDPSKARPEAFMVGSEFAHLHPPYDGSLHLVLPAEVASSVIDKGWGELHPMARGGGHSAVPLMVYGPRNDEELEVVWLILRASFEFAGGLDERASDVKDGVGDS